MEKSAKSVVKEQHERQKFATQVRFWFRQSTKVYYMIFVSCNANRLTFWQRCTKKIHTKKPISRILNKLVEDVCFRDFVLFLLQWNLQAS